MLNTMFAGVSEGAFQRCLELGAGDGFLSALLARHARLLFATEIRLGGLREAPSENVRYAFCDAEQLPFRPAKFDLIFTSHLLEHLPDLQRALADMRRTLDEKGVMVHLVPSRLWKILDLGLFFPSQIVHVLEMYTAPDGAPRAPKGMRSTVKTAPAGWWRRSFWPSVHGVSSSNVAELRRFGIRHWVAEFERAKLDVVRIRRRFPLHSPYRFGLERTRRALESFGASSTVGFVLAHAGQRPPAADVFGADTPSWSLA
jgi:ubiquinone/menaquinone biosynthesis C-methylase UbiE